MRSLAIDHGTKRMGIAVSDELKMIAQPLEFVAAEPFADSARPSASSPISPAKARPSPPSLAGPLSNDTVIS